MFEGQCVCVDYNDYPQAEFCNERFVHGRKEHVCCECRKTIPKGARHEYVSGKWDGSFSTYRTCAVCVAIRNDFMECGFIYGELWEELLERHRGNLPYGETEADDEFDWITP